MGQTNLDISCRKFFAEKIVFLKIRKDPFMFGIFYDYIKMADSALWRMIYSNVYSTLQHELINKKPDAEQCAAHTIQHIMYLMNKHDAEGDSLRVIEQMCADNGDIIYMVSPVSNNSMMYNLHRSCFTEQDPFLRCASMYRDCIEMPLLLMHLLQMHIDRTKGLSAADRQVMFLEGMARIFMKDEATVEKLITNLSVTSRRDLIRDAVLKGHGSEEAALLIQTADIFGLHSMSPVERYEFYTEVVRKIFPDIFREDTVNEDDDKETTDNSGNEETCDNTDTCAGSMSEDLNIFDQHTVDTLYSRKDLLETQYRELSGECYALSQQLNSLSQEKDRVSEEISELDRLFKSISDMKTYIDRSVKDYSLKYNVNK